MLSDDRQRAHLDDSQTFSRSWHDVESYGHVVSLSMGERVQIVEVSPRDGLQADPADLSTGHKVELITRLIDAGCTRIEATSFVSVKAVPKMADAEAVMAAVPRPVGVSYTTLAFNTAGLERAIAAGVDEINGVVIASETFSQRNQRASVAESLDRWQAIAAGAKAAGLRTSVTVSAAFGCPYDGEIDPDAVLRVVETLGSIGADEICLADTIGAAVPNLVTSLFNDAAAVIGDAAGVVWRGHFHNTRNTGLANTVAALAAGVRVFDTSLGGVGGCPFAPRATGNVPTEDVVHMLERMGYSTGLSLPALIETTAWFETVLGHGVPSLVAKAGPFPRQAAE